MSNTQVGNIYLQIITDVIDTSRVDFEDTGVEDHILEELRLGWQQKLSQLQVAQFPWDPKPEPVPTMSNPPTVPSNAGNYPSNAPPVAKNQNRNQTHNHGPLANRQPQIKAEPGLDHGMHQQPYTPMPLTLPANATQAQQRAAQHLHQNYGSRAAASINAIQGGPNQPQQMMSQQQAQAQQQQRAVQQQNGQSNMSMAQMQAQQQHAQQQQAMARQNQVMQGQGLSMQQQQQQQQQHGRPAMPPMTQDQYRQVMAQNVAARLQQKGGQTGVRGAQTDGAGDEVNFFAIVKDNNSAGEEVMGRIEVDGLIRSKIASLGTRMEGGGLMLPLHRASTPSKRQRKVKKSAAMQQTDGPDDNDGKNGLKDEVVDEDAINSDLDDPDEGLNDEEDEDDSMGHIMLCMYDKVQRVKNKWKCVMKDGVLTVNGKEYVFHKASGEYEW